MKRRGNILICVVGGLVLQTGASPAVAKVAENPYHTIATSNVFRLRPRPVTEALQPPTPPVPIILQGFSSYDHRKQALFRVGSTAFLLNEGERQGDIEVLEINIRAATVKFRNHGQIQSLGLVGPPGPGRTK